MTHYYSGQQYNIQSRLKREKRCFKELVCLHLQVKQDREDLPGWRPMPRDNFWPICPSVGDSFMMKAYWYYPDKDDDDGRSEWKTWIVVQRDLVKSGPTAREMNGVVLFTVGV